MFGHHDPRFYDTIHVRMKVIRRQVMADYHRERICNISDCYRMTHEFCVDMEKSTGIYNDRWIFKAIDSVTIQ